MSLEDAKTAVMNLSDEDKKRFILQVFPGVWSATVKDEACVNKLRELIDEAAMKNYREQHMDHV